MFIGTWSGCGVGTGELEENFFEADRRGAKFVEIPTGFDDGAGEVSADGAIVLAFHFEDGAILSCALEDDAADAGYLLETALYRVRMKITAAACDFDNYGASAAGAILQIVYRVCGDEPTFVDDDDLLAGLLDFGKDVGAENNGVIAGETLDEVAGFVDLLGVEAGGGLVKN